MKRIMIDSGPMIALFDSSDRHHKAAVDFISSNDFPLITTLASITETLHLLDYNRNVQLDFLEWIKKGAVEVHGIHQRDFHRLRALTEKYRDLPMDFADCCLVFLAEKLELDTIATIDRDFTVYRINGRKKFKLLLN